jgi:iron complex outermembrane receptor protein
MPIRGDPQRNAERCRCIPRKFWAFLTSVMVILVLPPSSEKLATAQSNSQTILHAAVTDGSGAVIANASVTLEDDRLQAVVHATTDEAGHYDLTASMPGIYRVKITAVTFSTFIFEDLGLKGGNLNLPDATLRPGTAILTVNITAAAAELAGGQIASVGHVGIFGDVLLQDVPFSVQSYASTFLVNQQALTLTDVLGSHASFVSPLASSKASPFADVFLVRGYRQATDRAAAVNGLFGLYGGLPSMEFVERVDVFHGPSAFVMGAPESVGGVLNMAPKQAGEQPLLMLEPSYLSKSAYGGHLDASGRVGPHNAFGGRVNGVYRDGEGQIRDSRLLHGGAAVGLDYRSKLVLLSLDTQYLRDYNQAYQYVVIPGPGLADLPQAMPMNLSTVPVWMGTGLNQKVILGRADVNLSPSWSVTTGSGFSHSAGGSPAFCPAILLDYSGTLLCEQYSQVYTLENYSNDVGARGKFRTGSLTHSVVAGWNRVKQTGSYEEDHDFGPSQPYNLYTPYRPTSPNFVLPESTPIGLIDSHSTKGWYLGDTNCMVRDKLLVTGGFRRSTVRLQDNFRDNIPPSLYLDSAFTPSVAALFQATPNISLYGNFIQALEPGAVAPPETKNAGQVFRQPSAIKWKQERKPILQMGWNDRLLPHQRSLWRRKRPSPAHRLSHRMDAR